MSTSIFRLSTLSSSPLPLLQMIGSIAQSRRGYTRHVDDASQKNMPDSVRNAGGDRGIGSARFNRTQSRHVERLRGQIEKHCRRVDQIDQKMMMLERMMFLRREAEPRARQLHALVTELRALTGRQGAPARLVDALLFEDADGIHVAAHTPTEKDAPVCLFAGNEEEALKEMEIDLTGHVTPVRGNIRSVCVDVLLERAGSTYATHCLTPSRRDAPVLKQLQVLLAERQRSAHRLQVLKDALANHLMPDRTPVTSL